MNLPLTPQSIASLLDHSTLQPFLTDEDVRRGCEIALKYQTASVCARPSDMPLAVRLLAGSPVKACTVIGFPHGTATTESKVFEARQALALGCEELDMVIHIGRMLQGDLGYVESDIRAVAEAAHAHGAILKVILENCYLSDEQKVAACKVAERAGADFVKTSTGYGKSGATIDGVRLMRQSVSAKVRVKAAGGMRDLDAVLAAKAAGAERCGVSATEAIIEEAYRRYEAGTLFENEAGVLSDGY